MYILTSADFYGTYHPRVCTYKRIVLSLKKHSASKTSFSHSSTALELIIINLHYASTTLLRIFLFSPGYKIIYFLLYFFRKHTNRFFQCCTRCRLNPPPDKQN